MSDLRHTEQIATFDIFVVTYGDHCMTSDLFSQHAEFLKKFPHIYQTLFGRPPGDPPPGPHCLSGQQDLETHI